MKNLTEIRHLLHSYAEVSGAEYRTTELIYNLLSELNPDRLYKGSNGLGVIAIFNGKEPGFSILFRADIDALPIPDNDYIEYASLTNGVSHKCGHDGHSAMLLGFARYCSANRPLMGRIILLFQNSEENGEGAIKLINSGKLPKVDYSFAIHNLPGFGHNSIILKSGSFAAASIGLKIQLEGISSHASEPELGISPVTAMNEIANILPILTSNNPDDENYSLATIVHLLAGTPTFGTAASNGLLMITLRAWKDEVLQNLINQIREQSMLFSLTHGLKCSVSLHDFFPATINDHECVDLVKEITFSENLEIITPELPFKWSEDFAHYCSISKGMIIGLGAGIHHPPLHSPAYNFPDSLITTGVTVWKRIYQKMLQ